MSIKEGTRQTREKNPVVAGYALTVNKAQGLTLKKGVVINLTSGKRFKAASKHGVPFVAFTRSESFEMTAFKNLPQWDDFQKGQDSDMLRMRKRFTEMLDRKHTETMRTYSRFQTTEDENEAYDMWKGTQAPQGRASAASYALPRMRRARLDGRLRVCRRQNGSRGSYWLHASPPDLPVLIFLNFWTL